MNKVVLTIAGSDPSGGAGIQSDLRTINTLGLIGISALTAITVQNSHGVFGVYPVAPDVLVAQINKLLEDVKPDAVKIGMLGSASQVEALVTLFEKRTLNNVVLDTVLASTGGVPLLDAAGRYLLITSLLRHCSVITPNIAEAELLTGIKVTDDSSIIAAGRQLLSMGANAVVVKGGHLPGTPTDWLVQRDIPPIKYSGRRIQTPHTHGTGCLLSTSIAACLALGQPLKDAVSTSKETLTQAIEHPVVLGTGRGYPTVANRQPSKEIIAQQKAHTDRLSKLHGLYVVTDPSLQGGRSHEDVVKAALVGGAQIIQLRDKTLETPALVECAKRLCALVHEHDRLFIVNDRVEVALASEADGVHLGPDDMQPADVRRLLGTSKLIGVSTGTVAEAIAAAPFASYFGVGAIFGSKTKVDAGEPVTPQRIKDIKAEYPRMPVVAIGGISTANIRDVIDAGAESVAVVSAVVSKSDITQAARVLQAYFRS